MDLTPYVDSLRRELALAAEAGGDDARTLADRLTAPLESAMRLTLLEALSSAAAEITRDLAPGSVHVRLSGRDADFVVAAPPSDPSPTDPSLSETPAAGAAPAGGPAPSFDTASPPPGADGPAGDGSGGTSRINLRLPDDVKARVEGAAERERISVNSWLVRAALAALDPVRTTPPPTADHRIATGQRYTGWAR